MPAPPTASRIIPRPAYCGLVLVSRNIWLGGPASTQPRFIYLPFVHIPLHERR